MAPGLEPLPMLVTYLPGEARPPIASAKYGGAGG